MSFVQRAHGRHQPYGFVIPAQFARDRAHTLTTIDDFHVGKVFLEGSYDVRFNSEAFDELSAFNSVAVSAGSP